MNELNIDQVELVSGGTHEIAEACLVGGGVGLGIGSFFTPAGGAIGGLAGCGIGIAIMLF